MSPPVFVDTQYLLGLLNPDDDWHARASAAAALTRGRRVTTDAVLVELADALCRRAHRSLAALAISELRSDPDIDCVAVDRKLFERALALYRARTDKDWSLTDCISFAVMSERKLEAALTADRHFEQAGFRALLREE